MLQLQGLVDAGNTVVVVEHDMAVVAESDWVIDMGPGAGIEGGSVATAGEPNRLRATPKAARPFSAKPQSVRDPIKVGFSVDHKICGPALADSR